MLCHLDMSGGERSHQSGWCEQACPGRLTEWSGHGWYLVPPRQSSARLRVRAASCEAICSERADRRRAECNSEMYCNICTLSQTEAQAAWLNLKLVVTIINLRSLFLLQYFSVSLMLCFGFGSPRGLVKDLQSCPILIRIDSLSCFVRVHEPTGFLFTRAHRLILLTSTTNKKLVCILLA